MRVALKDGQLTVQLAKPEVAKVSKALDVCTTVASVSPLAEAVKDAAQASVESLTKLLALCSKRDDIAGQARLDFEAAEGGGDETEE